MNIIALFSYIFNLYSIIIIISFYYHIQNLIMRTYCVCTVYKRNNKKTPLKRKKERGVKNDFGNERTRFWR